MQSSGTHGTWAGALVSILVSNALLLAGNGLFQTLLPLRISSLGFTTASVGVMQSSYYLGFFVGCLFCRDLIERVGQHRVFVAFCACVAVLTQLLGIFDSLVAVCSIRAMTGAMFAGLTSSVESWLHQSVHNGIRGRVYGIYSTVNYCALAGGQLLLNLAAAEGGYQFTWVEILFTLAIAPVALLHGWPSTHAPSAHSGPRLSVLVDNWRQVASVSPPVVIACTLVGFLYSTFYGMMPVLLVARGFSVKEISWFFSSVLVGALLSQFPAGMLADRVDKRLLIRRVALVATGASVFLMMAGTSKTALWLGGLIYVCFAFTQYGLVSSHINELVPASFRTATASLLLAAFSMGGLCGPIIVAYAMTGLGTDGLFGCNAVACAALAGLCGRGRTAGKDVL